MQFSKLSLLGLLYQQAITDNGVSASGVQSGPNPGSIYAGGMIYDTSDDMAYATGITYEEATGDEVVASSCFVSEIDMIDWSWDKTEVLGTPTVLESCQSLSMIDKTTLVVIGNSEPTGLHSIDSNKMTGFSMAVDKHSLTENSGFSLKTSSASKIPFPTNIVTNGDNIYIAALTSTDDVPSSASASASASPFPDWIENPKYGSSLDMTIIKLGLRQSEFLGVPDGEVEMTEEWVKEFPVDPEANGVVPRVYIGGMIVKNDNFLVVAGSTRGLGVGLGPAAGDDEDGFLTLVDIATGELLSGRKNNERIGSEEDDVISGICDDPNDPDSFYVVGATKGDMDGIQDNQLDIEAGSLQGFIQKMNANTLHGRWTVQFGAKNAELETAAYALGCVVSGGAVYVAGVVEGSAGMVQGQDVIQSFGGDDMWVAQLDGVEGTVNWLKQVGTDGDDQLARHGGIFADSEGNAVLFGDTTGSLYRTRDADEVNTDVFVMVLDNDDGNIATVGAPVAAPTKPPVTPTNAPVSTPTTPPVVAPTQPPVELNLAEVATTNGFSTLVAAVTASGQAAALVDPAAQLTVFAPTDAAFEALPAGALDYLLDVNNTDVLSYVLGYHVVPGVVVSTDLTDGLTATTLNGENVTFSIMDGVIKVEDAVIGPADVQAINGVIHAIDSVLIPPAPFALPLNIVQIGMADADFSTLVAAVTAAGLADALSSEIYTLFAPTNEAFAALPDGVLDYLLDNTDILAEVLMYHVAAGASLSSDIINGTEITTLLDGESLMVVVGDTGVTVGGAGVEDYDVMALNGVVHVINEVLLPPSLILPATIGTIISCDDFATLKSALEETGLFSSFVNSPNRYTIFAPSESAFDAFKLASPGTYEALLAEPDMISLKEILLYHAVSPELVSSVDIVGGVESVETLQGENVSFTAPMGEMMSIMVDDAKISTADVMALNGIVHFIDSVLTPSSVSVLPGIFQAANATGQFNTLLAAVNAAGLAESLNMPGPLTVFAPTDGAFAKVPGLASILANPYAVIGLLTYHVVRGSYQAADLVDGMQLTTMANKNVKVTVESDGTVMINNAMVVQANIMGSNGVVHGIDTLFDPKDAGLADVVSTIESTASPSASPTDSPTDGAMMTNTVLAILSSLAVAAGIAVV